MGTTTKETAATLLAAGRGCHQDMVGACEGCGGWGTANVARGEHSFTTHKMAGSLPHNAAHCPCAHGCTQTGPAYGVVPLRMVT